MVDYPKHLNTRKDYLYVKENFPREQWEGDFQALLDSCKDWFYVGTLKSAKAGVNDDTHMVVDETLEDGTTSYSQYELKENPNARIFQLGFTVEEVEGLLA